MRAGWVLPDSEEEITALEKKEPSGAPFVPDSAAGWNHTTDRIAAGVIKTCAWVAIVSLVLIFIFIGKNALPIFTSSETQKEASVGKMFLPMSGRGEGSAYTWNPTSDPPEFSLIPLLVGTLKVTVIALIFAIPLAVTAALFTSEFAPPWMREIIKPAIELLAGIPSVVVGFFCLMVLATWLQDLLGLERRLNAFSAGIGLGLAVIPIVYTMSEDAFVAVPRTYREGSIAMGASKWQTAWRVVLPAASPGLLAACVLGFGRAIGETMIVWMASGNAAVLSLSPKDSVRTFAATIAAELGEAVVNSSHRVVLFFIGAFLFTLTFVINLAGHWFISRLQKKLQGAV